MPPEGTDMVKGMFEYEGEQCVLDSKWPLCSEQLKITTLCGLRVYVLYLPLCSKSMLHFMSSPKISLFFYLCFEVCDWYFTFPVWSLCLDRSWEQRSSRTGPLPVQSHDRSSCPPQRHQPQRAILRGGWAREACPQAQSTVFNAITRYASMEEYFKESNIAMISIFDWTATSIYP